MNSVKTYSTICALLLGFLLYGCSMDFSPGSPFSKNQIAPTFAATDMQGSPVVLENLRGKMVMLHFWGTGCPHCPEDYPVMRQLYERHFPDELVIVGINVCDSAGVVRPYMERYDMQWPQILDKAANNAEIEKLYQNSHLPTFVLIDREGRIIAHTFGDIPRVPL